MSESVESPGAVRVRRCGYSVCGRVLPAGGPGRPAEYCKDRTWEPDGKTCKQMAMQERAAAAAAGLDAPLLTLRTLAGQVTAPAEGLQRTLAEVLAALAAVDAGGVARMQEAEQAMLAAQAHAAQAAEARQQAERAAEVAVREQAAANVAKSQALTQARDADTAAQRARAQAAADVAAAAQAQGRAEAAAEAAQTARDKEIERRRRVEEQADDLRAQLKDARASSRQQAEDLRAATADARKQAQRAATAEKTLATTAGQMETATVARDEARTQLQAVRAELTEANTIRTALVDEMAGLRTELAIQQAAAAAAAADAQRLQLDFNTERRDLAVARDELRTTERDRDQRVAELEHTVEQLAETRAELTAVAGSRDTERVRADRAEAAAAAVRTENERQAADLAQLRADLDAARAAATAAADRQQLDRPGSPRRRS